MGLSYVKPKNTEFRIGNWLEDENGYYQIEDEHLDPEVFNCLQTWPIRLNEDILIRLGFKNGGYEDLFWYHEKLEGLTFAGINWADSDTPEYQFLNVEIGKMIIPIYFVHEIQNLYFSILKEEIEFKN